MAPAQVREPFCWWAILQEVWPVVALYSNRERATSSFQLFVSI
jgi:hypothetical protein